MAEAVQGTAERFDVFAALPQPRFPGGARAALAAPGARDELVRAAGPALMQAWVAIAIGAAFLQNLRTALQKALTPRVGRARRHLRALPLRGALGGRASSRCWRCAAARLPRADAGLRRSGGCVGAVAQIAATLLLLARLLACATSRSATPSPRPRRCRRRCSGSCCSATGIGPLALAGHPASASSASCCSRPRAASAAARSTGRARRSGSRAAPPSRSSAVGLPRRRAGARPTPGAC